MAKLQTLKSLIFLFIVPGLIVGCQPLANKVGENANTSSTTILKNSKVSQKLVSDFNNNNNQPIHRNISNLKRENKNFKNEVTIFKQRQLLIVRLTVSYLFGMVMGALGMFIYQERKGRSYKEQANANLTGNSVTQPHIQPKRPVSSQTSTLPQTPQPPIQNTPPTPPISPQQSYTSDTYTRRPPTSQPLSLQDIQLVNTYNQDRNSLSKSATEVSETEESINQRRLGSNQPAILQKVRKSQGNYWIIAGQGLDYLVPKGNIKINEFNYETVTTLFNCQSYQRGYSSDFKLVKPAKVSAIDQERWQIKENGLLQF